MRQSDTLKIKRTVDFYENEYDLVIKECVKAVEAKNDVKFAYYKGNAVAYHNVLSSLYYLLYVERSEN